MKVELNSNDMTTDICPNCGRTWDGIVKGHQYCCGCTTCGQSNTMIEIDTNMLAQGITAICPNCKKETDYMCSHMVCSNCCPWNRNKEEKKVKEKKKGGKRC